MLGLRRALLALFAVGALFAALDIALIVISEHEPDKLAFAILGPLIGLSFIGTGAFAWWRRPLNRFGLLMACVGFAWFVAGLAEANASGLFTFGMYVGSLYLVLLVHMVLAFPSGRLETVAEKALVAAAYLDVLAVRLPFFLLGGDVARDLEGRRPDNAFALIDNPDLADVFEYVAYLIAAFCLIGTVVLLVQRRRRASPPQRRAQAPMFCVGLLLFATLALTLGLRTFGADDAAVDTAGFVSLAFVAIMPFAFLAGLVRTRYSRAGAVGELIERLAAAESRATLRDALADALGDRSLTLVYWRSNAGHFVTLDGRRVDLPVRGSGRAVTEVRAPDEGGSVEGKRIGAIIHDDALADEPDLVRAAAASVALALENERLEAELRARVDELQTSRARLLEVSMFERRRLERDLHDGAQQRLVALSLQLGLAERRLRQDPDTAERLMGSARDELQRALEELRELARGIHPAILTDRGLGPAIEALAERAPLPVDLEAMPPERLPAPVEAAAYFVVAESLTNVAKYASASHATVRVARDDGYAIVEVRDDGLGGADPAIGTGLRGLADRLAALDGRLEVHSPPGEGTLVRANIPCAA